jgi:signal transduction histidine kinase/integral membrane sensor domain MASE1
MRNRLRSRLSYVEALAGVFTLYLVTGKLGLKLHAVSGFATLVWLPTGLALAALLLGGMRLWPAIAVGAFVVNVTTGAPALVAGGITAGNTLEAVLGAYLLARVCRFDPSISRVRDVLTFAVVAASGSTFVSASIGVASLWLGGVIGSGTVVETWRTWWVGDALGDLVMAPILLVWSKPSILRGRWLEAGALVALTTGVALYVFALLSPEPYEATVHWRYLVFPLLIWAAVRFRQPGATTVAFVVWLVSIVATTVGRGSLAAGSMTESLLHLQIFMGVVTLTTLLLGAAIGERDQAQRRAEAAQQRASFLADASKILTSGLDYDQTVQNIARLIVPALGEHCTVDAVGPGGAVRRIAEASKTSHDSSEIPLATASSSSLTVPLKNRDRVLGAITFARAASEGQGIADDMAFSEEFATRAAIAIDNANLYAEAQQATRARDTFLVVAAHELRTPLTSLGLQVANLRELIKAGALSPDKLLAKFEVIGRQGDRLAALVESLLDVSQVMAGRFQIASEPFDVRGVVQDVVVRFRDQGRRAGCDLMVEADGALPVLGDRLRLEQIVTNLVGNAIKFGPGKPIRVELKAQPATFTLVVCDNGIGIGAADQERIFEKFERAGSHRSAGGLGLGLWIVRQIVDAMGGSISIASKLGEGSAFTVTLPRARPLQAEAVASSHAAAAAAGDDRDR